MKRVYKTTFWFSKNKTRYKSFRCRKAFLTVSDNQVKTREAEKILKSIPEIQKLLLLMRMVNNIHQFIFQNLYLLKLIGYMLYYWWSPWFRSIYIRKSPSQNWFFRMTFTHQMVRMIFLEQVYRAVCIYIGKEYHR